MQLKPYHPIYLGQILNQWKSHGKTMSPAVFPQCGIMVVNASDEVMASGFIYKTDSSMTYIDSFCVNPSLSKYERSEVLTLLAWGIKEKIEAMGEAHVVAHMFPTPTFKKLAEGFGMRLYGKVSMYYKNLRKSV